MCVRMVPAATGSDVELLEAFVRSAVAAAGADGVVIGMSGGLDSAVVTKLCADALGPEKVLDVFMPSGAALEEDREAVGSMAAEWGVELRTVDVRPAVDSIVSLISGNVSTPLERGNITARCRMTVLYALAKDMNRIVVGTSNLSEIMVGYFTKHGDGASDVALIAGLYKTQVREVAGMIGVPEAVIAKPPSAGLWDGQTDESELGMDYAILDEVLERIRLGMDDDRIASELGLVADDVAGIRHKMVSTEHKRVLPARPRARPI